MTNKAQALSTAPMDLGSAFAGTSEFERVARLAYSLAGLQLTSDKAPMVYSRLSKRIRARGIPSIRDYCDLLDKADGSGERTAFVNTLTTNVTNFMREKHHFERLVEHVLAMKGNLGPNGLRIWSAGCSTGQEPISLLASLSNAGVPLKPASVRVLATDIDTNALEQAKAGKYLSHEVQALSPQDLSKHFEPAAADGSFQVRKELHSCIEFRQLNLLSDWQIPSPFDFIFCRNVTIYFDEKTRRDITSRMAALLRPGGTLFVGHSERIENPAALGLKTNGSTEYRKNA